MIGKVFEISREKKQPSRKHGRCPTRSLISLTCIYFLGSGPSLFVIMGTAFLCAADFEGSFFDFRSGWRGNCKTVKAPMDPFRPPRLLRSPSGSLWRSLPHPTTFCGQFSIVIANAGETRL